MIDTTTWNLRSILRQSKLCSPCSSFSHLSSECEFTDAAQPPLASRQPQFSRSINPPKPVLTRSPRTWPLCFSWNESLTPGCSYPNYSYEHTCYWCASNPRVADKRHKAIQCLNRINKSVSHLADYQHLGYTGSYFNCISQALLCFECVMFPMCILAIYTKSTVFVLKALVYLKH